MFPRNSWCGKGDRKSNEALDRLPQNLQRHRMLAHREAIRATKVKLDLLFWSLHPALPPYIVIGLVIPIYSLWSGFQKPVGRHFSSSFKVGPTYTSVTIGGFSNTISNKTLTNPTSILLGRHGTFYVFSNKALVTRIIFVCNCNLFLININCY